MAEPRRILCVEDDRDTAALIAEELVDRGYEVVLAHDGREGFAAILKVMPDLVLSDISMPAMSGFDLLEQLIALAPRFSKMPFVFLTALTDRDNELKGRRLGADDYVTKPFALAELLARIDAVLRRVQPVATTPISVPPPTGPLGFDDVAIDLGQRIVTRAGEEVKLTHLEFELLVFFVRHVSQVFSRAQLFSLVWGQSAGSVRTVDNFVGQLRKRFEREPDRPVHFITVRGSGYRFDP
jgi:two-component system, OmpR family, alkaline phosphatase synthesis response regulator PhoP